MLSQQIQPLVQLEQQQLHTQAYLLVVISRPTFVIGPTLTTMMYLNGNEIKVLL